jgi:hypothetical protein
MTSRRRFLGVTAAASAACLAPGCAGPVLEPDPLATPSPSPSPAPAGIFAPKVNGGINVQPLRRPDFDPNEGQQGQPVILPELIAVQLRTVYELGFDGVRVTVPYGDRGNFLAGLTYVRAARALGIDALVLLANFSGLTMARALREDSQRPRVLALYDRLLATPPAPAAPRAGGLGPGGVGRVAFQILNEPVLFSALPPDVYVREVLRPCHAELRRLNPQIIVVSAAEVGTLDGPPRIRAMLEAGLEDFTDRIAYHVYNPEVIGRLAHDVRSLVWITETGTAGTERHLDWFRRTMPEIQGRIDDVSRQFFYVLYETIPRRFRLIDIQPDGSGYRAVRESAELCETLAQNVTRAAAGMSVLPFDVLIPDIRAYLPTPADVAAYDEAISG